MYKCIFTRKPWGGLWCFNDAILETMELLGCTYVIKGKRYPAFMALLTDPSITFVIGESGRVTIEFVTTLNEWKEVRRKEGKHDITAETSNYSNVG